MTQVYYAMEAKMRKQELAFVNEQSGIDQAVSHGINDLVEGHRHSFKIWLKQSQRYIRRGLEPGNGDALSGQIGGLEWMRSYYDGAIALAKARAAIEQNVFVLERSIGCKTQRGDVVNFFAGGLIQRFNVRQNVAELQTGSGQFVRGQSVKHKRIVGVWRVRQLDFHSLGSCLLGHHGSPEPIGNLIATRRLTSTQEIGAVALLQQTKVIRRWTQQVTPAVGEYYRARGGRAGPEREERSTLTVVSQFR